MVLACSTQSLIGEKRPFSREGRSSSQPMSGMH